MSIIIGAFISVLLVTLDLLSKNLIFSHIKLYHEIPLIDNFISIMPIYNEGAGWGIMQGQMVFLTIISSLATVLFCYLMKDCNFKRRSFYSIALVLMLSGTVGNLWDRAIYQKVRDFIYPNPKIFPANFNFADSFLTIGVILMAIHFIFFDAKDPVNFLPKRFNKAKPQIIEENDESN